mgnify:CR=1 FL=1
MALGLIYGTTETATSTEILPLVSYNSKAGRLRFTQRVEVGGRWEKQEEDVTFKQPFMVADLERIQIGWLFFKAGLAPVKAMVQHGNPLPPMPVGDFGVDEKGAPQKPKHGFSLRVLDSNRVLREFSSNAQAVLGAIDRLHTDYVTAPESKQGLLPVIQFVGAQEVRGKHGSNFTPIFSIVKWVPRPAEMGGTATAGAGTVAAPVAPVPAALPPATPQAGQEMAF